MSTESSGKPPRGEGGSWRSTIIGLAILGANFAVAWWQISSVEAAQLPDGIGGLFESNTARLGSATTLAFTYAILEMGALVLAWVGLFAMAWAGEAMGVFPARRLRRWLLRMLE